MFLVQPGERPTIWETDDLGGILLAIDSSRWRRFTVATLSIAVLIGPFVTAQVARAAAVPPCAVPGQITPHPTNWYSIKVPSFSAGAGTMSDYAVDTLVATRLWVTNGTQVFRSTDSGCRWTKVYELPSSGQMTAANSQILELEIGGQGTVYLPIQEEGPTERPHVVVSTDAGESWRVADGPVLGALLGRLRDFSASLGNGTTAAILLDVELDEPAGLAGVDAGQTLLTTSTAGETWEPAAALEGQLVVNGPATVSMNVATDWNSIAINPLRSGEIWLYGEERVTKYDGAMADVGLDGASLLDISLDGRAVLAYGLGETTGQLSIDGGITWVSVPTGVPVDSMDIIATAPVVEIATGSGGRVLDQFVAPGLAQPLLANLSPLDQRTITDVQVAFPVSGQRPSVHGRTASTIEVNFEPDPVPFDPNEVKASISSSPIDGNNHLAPAYTSVKMRPGQSRTIPYRLDLPAAATPLDVYFMIDISGSMQGTINGIRSAMQTIADRLGERGIDVQFGVGSFRSYDTPPAYKRNLDIQPAGAPLASALNSLRASGGGDESQMAALLQSVTGEGDHAIPRNQNMNFRPGSLRVAIEVTDEPISQGAPHPTAETVIEALLDHEVKQVGLAIQEPPLLGEHDYNDPGFGPAQGLIPIAKGSKAIAPAGGVDCDGDGDAELQEGDALVCLIDPNRAEEASLMANAIVHVLEAVQDIQDLEVVVGPRIDPRAESEVVESITPAVLPQLDLKEANTATFEVTVTCPHVPKPTLFPVTVGVSRPGVFVADAAMDVRCIPLPTEPKEELFVFSAFVPVAAVPPPPPRPPDPIPEPNPNPQPNPQQNPQAQAGFAAQEQQQPQVALAGQEAVPGPDVAEEGASEDYFMSDNSRSRVPPLAFIFTTASITAVGGYVLLTRQRTQTAHARNRRDRRR